jgi:hypothetical protein
MPRRVRRPDARADLQRAIENYQQDGNADAAARVQQVYAAIPQP